MMRRIALPAFVLAAGVAFAACGSQGVELAQDDPNREGAVLFQENCAGCHTLSEIGAEGSAVSIGNRERVDGPNFDQRAETRDQILYAIRNGGFSGAVMPENIVTGEEAEKVADFLAEYAGNKKPPPAGPNG
ncbi:MAG: cytochrome c [Solirubrobacteraceae bacterium]|nr:cytochrome c [Solirubrobacteraceae bacterium]